ncbi:MAG: CRISPR-associated protein Cas4 [Ectobacillus sp.]
MEEVMISALQHYAYCPRQCALIHLEQVFTENEFTMQGNISHKRVHEEKNGTAEANAMTLWSDEYGLIGKSDKIEWNGEIPIPVEYKHGRINKSTKIPDEIQLCAQALCLEEMFQIEIEQGEIFYASSKKRKTVPFTNQLRQQTKSIIEKTREMIMSGELPPPVNDQRCKNCSLIDICMPDISLRGSWESELGKVAEDGAIT